jgi:hypothetical protein
MTAGKVRRYSYTFLYVTRFSYNPQLTPESIFTSAIFLRALVGISCLSS